MEGRRAVSSSDFAVVSFPMWGMHDALEVVRELQPKLRPHFHVALAGGVLNKGMSFKDLDLVILTMGNQSPNDIDWSFPLSVCSEMFGPMENIVNDLHYPDGMTEVGYRMKVKFYNKGKRVDVFVMGPPHPTKGTASPLDDDDLPF
jgi:hypothetical protein